MPAELLWKPTNDEIKDSNLTNFINALNSRHSLNIKNYSELYDWSVNNIEEFWKAVWDFFQVIYSGKIETTLHNKSMPDGNGNRNVWFKGASLNFAENLLRRRDDGPAIISIKENEAARIISFNELYELTSKCARGLKDLGINKGDRVAAIISNVPEAIIGALAASSIGAVWSSTSPDFGYKGIIERFKQIEPSVLIGTAGYSYNGRKYSIIDVIKETAEHLPELKKAVIITESGENYACGSKFITWAELIDNDATEIKFEQLPFNHPLYIMYSSGTTGSPKCIVHGAGGTLIQHVKELGLHTDLKGGERILYYTTTGWMMWNWLISSLSLGATVVLYDGSPAYPDISVLWNIIENHNVNVFGTSPKFLSSCQSAGYHPIKENNLKTLHAILSTGSPLSDENFKWVYNNVKKDIRLSSISGGTDIISCFMLGSPISPVYSGEIQAIGLGMKVMAYNDKNEPVVEEKGELVCAEVFPSMPIYFWGDNGNKKYYEAYFKDIPGVWKHGDYIKITERGGVVVYGRSDATLNPGGVRIGTAEIYHVAESIEGITDSLALGIPKGNDIEVVLFVALKEGFILDDDFKKKIKNKIKEELTPRHVPNKILQFKESPITLNGKKVEIAALKKILGEEVTNESALKNPESLKQFEGLELI